MCVWVLLNFQSFVCSDRTGALVLIIFSGSCYRFFEFFCLHCFVRCHDEGSLNEVSLNIITGIINHLDFKTLGQIIPEQRVPTLDCIQAVDNHNSYWWGTLYF